MNHFEELRRTAFDRGRRDYLQAKQIAEQDGAPIFKNNPHQNNAATDEREYWNEGWDAEKADDGSEDTSEVDNTDKGMWPFPEVHGVIPG